MDRYNRQQLLSEFKDQEHLIHSAKIAVVGAGGVGSCCLEYLAAAGVKELLVIDCDNVEVQNLHRQVIHSEPGEEGAPNKAVSAV